MDVINNIVEKMTDYEGKLREKFSFALVFIDIKATTILADLRVSGNT